MGGLRFRLGLAVDGARSWFGVPLRCDHSGTLESRSGRASPAESLSFTVGGRDALLCYSRPRAQGRKIFGGVVPYDELWRTGANEPTVLHLPFAAELAGVAVRKGKYALYTVPRAGAWTLVVNRSTRQWGLTRPERGPKGNLFPSAYTSWVQAAELARVEVETRPTAHVEQFTARAEIQSSETTIILLEWETVQVRIPIRLAEGA